MKDRNRNMSDFLAANPEARAQWGHSKKKKNSEGILFLISII